MAPGDGNVFDGGVEQDNSNITIQGTLSLGGEASQWHAFWRSRINEKRAA